ncbi:hypothetical protein KIPB_013172, partial [Kipferlia bialata]|eukprot:g13172.t1
MSILLRPNYTDRVLVNISTKEKGFLKKLAPPEAPWMCPNDGYIVIRNSDVCCGTITKSTITGGKNGILYFVIRSYTNHDAAVRMSRIAKLTTRFLRDRGFSIGIEDVTPSKRLLALKKSTLQLSYDKCDDLIREYEAGTLQPKPGCTALQTLEAVINGELSRIREQMGTTCIEELHWTNSPGIMAKCGSKGSTINISQMVACVGQQTINGGRVADGFLNRALPHFEPFDRTPSAKGFVANSFFSGLTPSEFFFHTMAGREGLIDTAVKTAETGYMQRRLVKALEDLVVSYDTTVRDSRNNIVQ